jgi:hypothetical protein
VFGHRRPVEVEFGGDLVGGYFPGDFVTAEFVGDLEDFLLAIRQRCKLVVRSRVIGQPLEGEREALVVRDADVGLEGTPARRRSSSYNPDLPD